jgi:hypothetical protein
LRRLVLDHVIASDAFEVTEVVAFLDEQGVGTETAGCGRDAQSFQSRAQAQLP